MRRLAGQCTSRALPSSRSDYQWRFSAGCQGRPLLASVKPNGAQLATTQLFVELLVIGVGVATWLAMALAVVFGIRWDSQWLRVSTAQITVLLGLSYVLGILVDRAAYRLFKPLERRRSREVFGDDPDPSVSDRERAILVKSASLREQVHYNRSRVRICRSWILNFALIALFSGVWAAIEGAWPLVVISGSSAILTGLTASATNSLVRDHYNNVRYSFEFLERERPGDSLSKIEAS